MIIQHNLPTMNAHRTMSINNRKASSSLEKLASGFRVNRAADDAAGLAISEKMRGQIRGLSMAEMNVQHGIAMIQTAEGGCNEIQSILQRMRKLSVQSSNGTYQNEDREQLDKEFQALKEEVTRIAETTHFNGIHLLTQNGIRSSVRPGTNGVPELGDWWDGVDGIIRYDLKDMKGVSGTYVDGSPGAIQETLYDWFGIAGAFLHIEAETGAANYGYGAFDLIVEANGNDPPTLYAQFSTDTASIAKGVYDSATGKYTFDCTNAIFGPVTVRLWQGDIPGVNSQVQGGFGSGAIRMLFAPDTYDASISWGGGDSPGGYDINTPIPGDDTDPQNIFDIAYVLLHEGALPPNYSLTENTGWGERHESGKEVILQIGANGSADQKLAVSLLFLFRSAKP